jgi:peptide deformylase
MVREIVHDPLILARKSSEATAKDAAVAVDLMDTLMAHREHCVGMAANMIGVHKRIIAVANGPFTMVMFNPKILSKSGEYEVEEGCLSLAGVRKVKRWKSIRVQWQDAGMKEHVALLDGFQAQIVQHEIDHCDGILI